MAFALDWPVTNFRLSRYCITTKMEARWRREGSVVNAQGHESRGWILEIAIERVANPKGDRVKITMSGKFLPYKYYGASGNVPEYGFKEE